MASYSFSPVSWGGQSSVTTGHHQADAGGGKRTEAKAAARKGSAMPQPLEHGQTHVAGSAFEVVSNMTAALLAGDGQAATALINLGSLATQSVATGRLARGR